MKAHKCYLDGVAFGGVLERKAIRRAIARALRELRVIADSHEVGRRQPGRCGCNLCIAVRTIDRATRRARTKGKRP